MPPVNSLINKISDYLENRQKTTNFGTCKRCSKNVYWSTTKVASHIRSGHCSGTSEEEVKRFKLEFIYDSPKNLVHKSSKLSNSNSKESDATHCIQLINVKKENISSSPIQRQKRTKLELNENSEDQLLEEQIDSNEMLYEMDDGHCDETGGEKIQEIYYVTEAPSTFDKVSSKPPRVEDKCENTSHELSISGSGGSKEEKFISVVYPQFKGRSKLQLIDEILDLKRRNELLQIKVKTYENTINKLL